MALNDNAMKFIITSLFITANLFYSCSNTNNPNTQDLPELWSVQKVSNDSVWMAYKAAGADLNQWLKTTRPDCISESGWNYHCPFWKEGKVVFAPNGTGTVLYCTDYGAFEKYGTHPITWKKDKRRIELSDDRFITGPLVAQMPRD